MLKGLKKPNRPAHGQKSADKWSLYILACCDQTFYSVWRLLRRVSRSLLRWRHPVASLIGNLSYRTSLAANRRGYRQFVRANEAQDQPAATLAG